MQIEELSVALSQAFVGDQAAQQRIDGWVNTEFDAISVQLATIMATAGSDAVMRQSAALCLKNTISAVDTQNLARKHQRWKQLDAGVRKQVKDLLLQGIQQPEIAHTVANTLAHVASVELPFQEWPELIPQLSQWVIQQPENPQRAMYALEALGFIAENLATVQDALPDVPDLDEGVVNSMLTAIFSGASASAATVENRKAGLQALKHALQFVKPNMDKPNERNAIVQCMCEAATAEQPGIRTLAFYCLEETCELYYSVLNGDYIKAIFDLTMQTLQRPDEQPEVKMASIQVWTIMAATEEAIEESQNYVLTAAPMLVPQLLHTLLQQDEDADEDEWNLQAAGAVCLEYVAQAVGSPILETVMPFVSANIGQADWRQKDAATVAFMCVLDGPTSNDIGRYIVESIPVLLNLFQDPHIMVRDSAVHCVGKIGLLHMDVLATTQVPMAEVLKALLDKLQDVPRVAANSCTALFSIAQAMREPETPANSLLSEAMLRLLQDLLKTAERGDADEHNLRTAAFSAAGELIYVAPLDTSHFLVELLPAVMTKLDAGLKIIDTEAQTQVVGGLVFLLSSLITRMEMNEFAPHCDNMVNLLLRSFTSVPGVAEDIITAFSNLASKIDDNFTKYLNAVMPHIKQGVANFTAQSLCTVAIGSIVDISAAVGGALQPHCDDLMRTLLGILKDSSVDRDLKPFVFSCLGDICLAVGAGFAPYMQMSTMMLLQASQSPMPADGDEETVMFISGLRKAVLEAYSGIIIGLTDGQMMDAILPVVPNILSFLQFITQPDQQPLEEDVIVQGVSTLGDLAQSCGSAQGVAQALRQHRPALEPLLRQCPDSSALQWAGQQLNNVW